MLENVSLRSVWINALAGLWGGIGLCVVGHPFETVKLKLQAGLFPTPMAAIRHILAHQGLQGFYAGVSSPLGLQMVFRAWLFVAFQITRDILGPSTSVFVCGAFTGLAAAVVESPMLLLMNQAQARPGSSVLTRAAAIWGARGAMGFTQGMTATAIRNIPSNAYYLGVFWSMRERQYPPLAAGAVAGVSYWLFTYPLDAVRGCMHADEPELSKRKYSSYRNCVATLYREGGWRRFYKGYGPCLARAVPANATFFMMAEQVRTYFA
jgi:solute carrier family 25 carnitine/acylcarnitine transporter 20/29